MGGGCDGVQVEGSGKTSTGVEEEGEESKRRNAECIICPWFNFFLGGYWIVSLNVCCALYIVDLFPHLDKGY